MTITGGRNGGGVSRQRRYSRNKGAAMGSRAKRRRMKMLKDIKNMDPQRKHSNDFPVKVTTGM